MVKKLFTIFVILLLLFPSINVVKSKNENIAYPPVALFEYKQSKNCILFNASASYGGNLKYRWDFDNDGVYDTRWLSSPTIKHVYNKPYNGFVRLQVKNEDGEDECIMKVIACNSGIDQKQEQADAYVKIYGDKAFAQTFKPSMLKLEGLDIYVGKEGKEMPPFIKKLLDILSTIFGAEFTNKMKEHFLGDLKVSIFEVEGDDIQGRYITGHTFKAYEISKAGGWIHADFENGVDLKWNKTYAIVVYQTGGNERNYYKWYYGNGDLYENGMFYEKINGNWNGDIGRDFCFRTYAELSGDEPDGIIERWAVLIGVENTSSGLVARWADEDVYDEKNCLISHGWKEDHIITLISPTITQIQAALDWMARNDDVDDAIDIVTWSAHGGEGGSFAAYDGIFSCYTMDYYLDKCSAKGILVVADTCYSGSVIRYLAQDGRVILTSSAADKPSGANLKTENSLFMSFLFDPSVGAFWKKSLDKNNDGWISAEEAFPYAKEKTDTHYPGYTQNPQMFDGYPTIKNNSSELLVCYVG